MTVEKAYPQLTDPPLVSVVIPTFNSGPFIQETLESVVRQKGRFSLEIIVVDDGSTDDTVARVGAFDGVKLIRQVNAGPSAARNRGIASAEGDFIAFLDADDLWPANKLAVQMALFAGHPELGMVFGDCRHFDQLGARPRTQFEDEGLDADFFGGEAVLSDPYAGLFKVNYVPTGTVVARRDCLQDAGLFDESRRYVEDWDLWIRIALRCKLGYTREICQLKRAHANGLSADRERMTLAFIEVLASHAEAYGAEMRRRGLRAEPRMAFEYCLVGDARERQGDLKTARRRYLQAFATYPSLRPLYYWARSWLPKGSLPRARS
jgi:glycosyltransferase involved in cell wall biosynthesis